MYVNINSWDNMLYSRSGSFLRRAYPNRRWLIEKEERSEWDRESLAWLSVLISYWVSCDRDHYVLMCVTLHHPQHYSFLRELAPKQKHSRQGYRSGRSVNVFVLPSCLSVCLLKFNLTRLRYPSHQDRSEMNFALGFQHSAAGGQLAAHWKTFSLLTVPLIAATFYILTTA